VSVHKPFEPIPDRNSRVNTLLWGKKLKCVNGANIVREKIVFSNTLFCVKVKATSF